MEEDVISDELGRGVKEGEIGRGFKKKGGEGI
jgi:hypothetical protein